MFCPSCGVGNSDDAAFCKDCGKALPREGPMAPAPVAPASVAPAPVAPASVAPAPVAPVSVAPPGHELSGRWGRLGAKLLDSLVYLVAYIPLVVLAIADQAGVGFLLFLLGFAGIAILQVVWLSTDGQTIGKKILGIKIVSAKTGLNGGFGPNVLLRAWLTFVISVVPIIGWVFAAVDVLFIFREDKRCIHDLIAGTSVVKA